MKLSSAIACQTALLATLAQNASAFAPTKFVPHTPARHFSARSVSQPSQSASSSACKASMSDQCLLTPEGFGFSSTAERIIEQAKRGEAGGYVRVKADARVIDVMAGITSGDEDVALVYENAKLLGIFTESDYINVSIIWCMACDVRVQAENERIWHLFSQIYYISAKRTMCIL